MAIPRTVVQVPFTPSHAVVALIFRGRMIPASAVAVGAMTPDLPLFVPFALSYAHTHNWRWLPITLLIAVAVWSLWRWVVAPTMSDLAPAWLAARFRPGPRSGRPAAALIGVAAGLLIGILTHIVWDSFTHRDRWGTDLLPFLGGRIGNQPIYSVLQEVSSILGLVVIAIWVLTRQPQELDLAQRTRAKGVRVATQTGIGAALMAAIVIGLTTSGPLWRQLFEFATMGGVMVAIVLGVGVAAWWMSASPSASHRRRSARPSPGRSPRQGFRSRSDR